MNIIITIKITKLTTILLREYSCFMIKRIYHGSNLIIKQPELGKGKIHNDYGQGFYCTEDKNLAMEWAVDEAKNGFANCYDIDLEGLDIIDLCSDKYTILNWLEILIENRIFDMSYELTINASAYLKDNFSVDYHNCDLMVGYRADDSYFAFARDFLNGAISLRQLNRALYLGKLGTQIVLKSENAFDRLRYVSSEEAESSIWYPKKKVRDRSARNDYKELRQEKILNEDIYMIDLIRGDIKADDERLRRGLSI